MTAFGDQLRTSRQRCHDSKSPHGKLTQETFGELVGREVGINGYTGAAVSDWERGKSKIHAEDRRLLLIIVKVLHAYGGIKTVQEADQLLRAGNYRELNEKEAQQIFDRVAGEPTVGEFVSKRNNSESFFSSLVENVFAISEEDLREALVKTEEGPFPSWPRKLAFLMRKASERWSLSLSTIFWVIVWALARWLISPSLRLPFSDQNSALSAMIMYVGGTVAIPLLIGLLVKTKDSDYWGQQGLAHTKLLRLYTYQGAAIGFNLGYFFIFPFALIRYYLQLGPSVWPELAAVTLGLILGSMGARVVPHNLWLAYHRLLFKDGAIFFVAAFVGPLWGIFFLKFRSILLEPFWGGMVILVALILLILIPIGGSKKQSDREQAQP